MMRRDAGGRTLLAGLAVLLPQRVKHLVYRRLFGWEIHPTAVIGLTFVHFPEVQLGEGARIGHFNFLSGQGPMTLGPHAAVRFLNFIHGCEAVEVGEHAVIGYHNWISGPPRSTGLYPNAPERRPEFHLGAHSTVVWSHRIDCADRVTIGRFCDLGGTQSQVLTHAIDVQRGVIVTEPVEIGDYCLIGTGVLFQAGARVPPRSMIAPRSVVHGALAPPEHLFGGVPAKPIKGVAGGKYFSRTVGRVD